MAERKQSLLVASDLHRGAGISQMPAYEKELRQKMGEFDHVVLNGDIFELFYVDRSYYKLGPEKSTTRVIRTAIIQSIRFMDEFLTEHPDTQLHYVMGNHENIRKFRTELDKLSKKHKNFEWSPETIRIGDALFVHGDLPMSGETNETRPVDGLKEATKHVPWSKWMERADEPGQMFVDKISAPNRAAAKVHRWLTEHDGKGSVTCSHEGKEEPLELKRVKHVFFGHTHVKFDNLKMKGLHYHNTGGLTGTVLKKRIHGMLEAEIDGDAVTKVRPFLLSQDQGREHDARQRINEGRPRDDRDSNIR